MRPKGCGKIIDDHKKYTCGMGVWFYPSLNSEDVFCDECRREIEMIEKIEDLEKKIYELRNEQLERMLEIEGWVGLTKFVVISLAASQLALYILHFGG